MEKGIIPDNLLSEFPTAGGLSLVLCEWIPVPPSHIIPGTYPRGCDADTGLPDLARVLSSIDCSLVERWLLELLVLRFRNATPSTSLLGLATLRSLLDIGPLGCSIRG